MHRYCVIVHESSVIWATNLAYAMRSTESAPSVRFYKLVFAPANLMRLYAWETQRTIGQGGYVSYLELRGYQCHVDIILTGRIIAAFNGGACVGAPLKSFVGFHACCRISIHVRAALH